MGELAINCMSEKELIEYINSDDTNKNNSELLSMCLNNKCSLNTILLFNMEAFNSDNCYLFIDNYNLSEEDYKNNMKLMDNNFIKQAALRTYPNLINYVNIDENVINWVSNSNRDYTINEELLLNNDLLMNNTNIVKKCIKNNPSILKKLLYLNEDIVKYAMEQGYIPTKDDFMSNLNLANYESLVMASFEKDPSIIIFMEEPMLNYNTVFSASTRGYLLTLDDIIFNPQLGAYCSLIRPVLKDNPELIKYIKEGCYLLDNEIIEALEKVTITRKDFLRNPSLCKIGPLMAILRDNFDENYKLYSSFLSEEEKIDFIKEYMSNNKSMSELPFFEKKFGSKVDPKKLDELVNILDFKVDNDNLDIQSSYYRKIDLLIDGVLRLKYDKSKKHTLYSDIVAVNNDIMKCFKTLKRNNGDKSVVYELVDKLYEFTGETIDHDFILNNLKSYYDYYLENGYISLLNTSSFCNLILNYNRNYFMSREKKQIIKGIKNKLEISNKRKKNIINRKKLDVITNYIINKDFDKLGFTEEEYDKHIDVVTNFKLDRNIRKEKIVISDEKYNILKNEFKRIGELNKYFVMQVLDIDNEEIAQYIAKKFTRVKTKSFSVIKINDSINYDSVKPNLSFNTTNFIFGNNNTYRDNLSKLLLQLDEESLDAILENKEVVKQLKELLLLVDLVDEFDIDILIKILSNSKKITDKLNTPFNLFNNMLNKIYLVINLAKGYASIDDIILYSLGDEVVAKLGENVCSDYYNLYKSMLRRTESNIPPVQLEYNNYTFKSGDYAEAERLLIGKLYETSCIELNNPGEETYLECLNKPTGDVILIRNENKELVDRMILIRRGNVVQIIMVALHTFPLEVYNNIASQILSQAKSKGDNIDYVAVARGSIKDCDNVTVINNPKFITKFPHADLSDSVVFLGNSEYNNIDVDDINLKFKSKPKCTYLKKRSSIDQNPTAYQLTRLKALNISLEDNEYIKERLVNTFEPVEPSLYFKTVCGEDWYLGMYEDGTFDELILSNGDTRSIKEIEEIKSVIMEELNNKNAKVMKKTL